MPKMPIHTLKKILTIFLIGIGTNVIAQDLMITSAPTINSGCNLSCSNPVTITIYNNGPGGIFVTPVTVSYTINAGAPVSESFSLTSLPFGGVYTYTFLTPASFCNQGTYVVDFNVNMVGDLNPANDNFSVTIVNDTTVVGGTLLGSDTVCISGNTGFLTLTGYTGYPDYWQYSTDGGTSWITIADTNDYYNYVNVDSTSLFMVHLDGGYCPDGWSPWALIKVDDTTNAGVVVGDATVCSTSNSGTLNVTGNNGLIIEWQTSPDAVTWTSTGIDTSFINYSNLSSTLYYQVWVQNGVCPPDYSTMGTITVTSPPIPGSVTADATVCYGSNSGNLSLIGYSGTIQYWMSSTDNGTTWTPISNTTPFQSYTNLTDTTIYAVVLQNGVCPSDTSVFATITVLPPLVAYAGADTTIYIGDTVCLNASGGVFYIWTPGLMMNDSTIQNPCIIADSLGSFTYQVVVSNLTGCSDNDFIIITVLDTATYVVPPKTPNLVVCNFITPNNDGDNDVWNIIDIEYFPDNEVTVMNNHGQVVFIQNGYNNTWTGDGLPDGSYYYLVKVNPVDRTFKGVLTIASSK